MFRRRVGTARFEFRGGEALHVFFRSKVGELVSLCNLKHAEDDGAVRKIRDRVPDPTKRCDQCIRTLRSHHPNPRLARYLQGGS